MDFRTKTPKLPDFTSPKPGTLGRLDELKFGERQYGGSASPYKAAPSPSLAKIVAETPDTVKSPMIDMIRERTAEEIVADIDRQCSPAPDQDVLSDAKVIKVMYSLFLSSIITGKFTRIRMITISTILFYKD